MLTAYPALSNYNHVTLRQKLQQLADLLQVHPQQLGPALASAPKVLGFSLQQLEHRLAALGSIQPDRQLLAQVVLEAPLLLTWSSQQLRNRLSKMESLLGLSSHSLATLLQQHPQLLPASSHLRHTLQLVQQLLLLAAASEQAGFGTGVVSSLQQDPGNQRYSPGTSNLDPQQQAVAAAARRFVLQHPQVLLLEPELMQARVAAMQATSGLPVAQVAAMLISQPALLLDSDGGGMDRSGRRQEGPQQQGKRRVAGS